MTQADVGLDDKTFPITSYTTMGLESVELVMAFEEEFGISISDEDAAGMLTPAMVIAWISEKVNASLDRSPCISMVEFHRVREQYFTQRGIPRREVKLQTTLSGRWFRRRTVRDEVSRRVEIRVKELMKQRRLNPQWKHSEVREVVRHIIREQLGAGKFSDRDEFIRDLGMD